MTETFQARIILKDGYEIASAFLLTEEEAKTFMRTIAKKFESSISYAFIHDIMKNDDGLIVCELKTYSYKF